MSKTYQRLRVALVAGFALITSAASAQVNFPNTSSSYGGNDRVNTSNGASCSSYVGSRTRLEMGGVSDGREGMGFARIVIPLGRIPKRVDCGALYRQEQRRQELMLRRMEIENELLEAQLKGVAAPSAKGDDW